MVILGVTYYGASRAPVAATMPVKVGALVYEAKLAGDGDGFGLGYIIGDPSASTIVEFWFNLATPSTYPNGHLLIALSTAAEALQLAYFAGGQDIEYLGPQVPIPRLQSGRSFTISVRVDPPHYEVYLEGHSTTLSRFGAEFQRELSQRCVEQPYAQPATVVGSYRFIGA